MLWALPADVTYRQFELIQSVARAQVSAPSSTVSASTPAAGLVLLYRSAGRRWQEVGADLACAAAASVGCARRSVDAGVNPAVEMLTFSISQSDPPEARVSDFSEEVRKNAVVHWKKSLTGSHSE